MKKHLLLLLMAFAAISIQAQDIEVDGYAYTIISEDEVEFAQKLDEDRSLYSGNIVIPESIEYERHVYTVTNINPGAFFRAYNVTSVTIPKSIRSIAYLNYDEKEDTCPFSDSPLLEAIVVEEGNPVFDSREKCNAIIKTADNMLLAGCINTTIPSSVTIVLEIAFYVYFHWIQ